MNLNSPKPVVRPGSAALDEALKLLTTLGDKNNLKPILEEMRKVQIENEKIYSEAVKAKIELGGMNAALEEREKQFIKDKNLSESELDDLKFKLGQRESKLNQKEEMLAERERGVQNLMDSRDNSLREREALIDDKELTMRDREARIESDRKIVDRMVEECMDRKSALQGISDYISSKISEI